MIVPDVNLLLYAEIAAFPEHPRARKWWERALSGDEDVGIAPPAAFGFVRIASNPRVFKVPLAVDDALARVEAWLEQPNARLLVAGPKHLALAFDLLRDLGAAGNLTTDAQLAAFALEHRATLCSHDADFARFPGLSWSDPLAS